MNTMLWIVMLVKRVFIWKNTTVSLFLLQKFSRTLLVNSLMNGNN